MVKMSIAVIKIHTRTHSLSHTNNASNRKIVGKTIIGRMKFISIGIFDSGDLSVWNDEHISSSLALFQPLTTLITKNHSFKHKSTKYTNQPTLCKQCTCAFGNKSIYKFRAIWWCVCVKIFIHSHFHVISHLL